MAAHSRITTVVCLVLLVLPATALFGQTRPRALTGSLTGKLTNTHSVALERVSIALRNTTTGAETKATTSRDGRYSFGDLPPGEYTLLAYGSMGSGSVTGIVISAGHESRVQSAIEFRNENRTPENLSADQSIHQMLAPREPDLTAARAGLLHTGSKSTEEQTANVLNAAESSALQPLQLATARVTAVRYSVIAAALARKIAPQPAIVAFTLNEIELSEFQLPARSVFPDASAQFATASNESIQSDSEVLDASQLQALPVAGRDWQAFLADSAPAANGDDEHERTASSTANGIALPGVSLQSGFGQTGRSRGTTRSRSISESAISTVVTATSLIGMTAPIGENTLISVETRSGTEKLHGQVFVFDRQNLWRAQNPFTQGVKETYAASGASVPTFTPEPFTPSDRQFQWGAGLGGVLRKQQLFWFAALDSYVRDNPGVATVKHPESFFAQPSNDQMQLLSAQLGLSNVDPVSEGVHAYSKLLESLAGLLGPAPRTAQQWTGFLRLDRRFAERHGITLEASGAELNSPGGGFTRASEFYGSHSFGSTNASDAWLLGKWEAFATPNLLLVTQGSFGHKIEKAMPEAPSEFERSLSINAWGQLPQIVVDSRNGFTIGNPARFGRGHYPLENLVMGQEQVNWVNGNLLMKAGVEIQHDRDATSRLRNQTGTYHYSSIEDFASDALAFSAFGLNGQLDPMNQHNCDQRGKPWRDGAGVLHGLGYLPCYSYYSQSMGPSDWWLATNDWAGYVTSQWQPSKSTVLTLAMRWEREQLPPAIPQLNNPDLPLTLHLPDLGNQWAPRAGFVWGRTESHWPVLRFGYGMYYSRTQNSVVESALTQTGSSKGDLNFFMRPTDNLYGGGAPPFPYVFAGEPSDSVKPGAVTLAPTFRNGEIHQAEASIGEALPGRVHLETSAVVSLARRLPVTFDANIDPAANPKTITYAVIDGNGSGPIKQQQITVPFFASWPSNTSPTGFAGRLNPKYQQVSEIHSRANSTYEAFVVRLSRNGRGLSFRTRYTYAHAMDWNPDESSQAAGPSILDPNDLQQEYGTSSLDVRHSLTTAVILEPRWKLKNVIGQIANGWMLSSVGRLHSGLPFTMRTSGSLAKEFDMGGTAIVGLSTGMNGYGGENRVYGIGRNTFRYPATWKADLRLAKRFNLGEMRQLELMAESFNLFNHQNVTELETVGYTIESGTANGALPRLNFLTGLKTGQTEFGQPLNVNATDAYRERRLQFGARFRF